MFEDILRTDLTGLMRAVLAQGDGLLERVLTPEGPPPLPPLYEEHKAGVTPFIQRRDQ